MSTGFYTRTDTNAESRELRKFPPLPEGHPLLNGEMFCLPCGQDFEPGDVTTLIPLGPGPDVPTRASAILGVPYNAVAVPVHWSCAGGKE